MRKIKEFLEDEIEIVKNRDDSPFYDGVCVGMENSKELNGKHILFCEKLLRIINKGDKEMEKSKMVEKIDYDKEVDTLLKMGGQKALENQYKNISRRLDVISDENRRLRLTVKRYEEEHSILRTRCTDSARDMFDKKMYGCLSVVRGRKELDCGLNFDSPLDFAKSLIEHRTHVDELKIKTDTLNYTVPEHDKATFDYDQLEEIAEYLLTYCKRNKEDL